MIMIDMQRTGTSEVWVDEIKRDPIIQDILISFPYQHKAKASHRFKYVTERTVRLLARFGQSINH